MAITIDDFSKIWASSSPLTPYEFSENNYKAGWNFVGATPPSRQMWDFLQKQNDEKLKYLLDNFDNYLPLSGGTMTGEIVLKDTTTTSRRNVTNSWNLILGGTSDNDGAYIRVDGKTSIQAGCFQLKATDGINSGFFVGRPDGTLTWNGNNIAIANKTFQLSDDLATTIPSGADLNNYTTAGTYITGSSAITNSLTNCPVRDTSMKLVVLYTGYGHIAFGGTQIIFSLGGIFARCNSSSVDNPTWSAWKTIVSY